MTKQQSKFCVKGQVSVHVDYIRLLRYFSNLCNFSLFHMTCFFCICTSLKIVLAKALFIVSLHCWLAISFFPLENSTLQIDAILLARDSKKEVEHCKNKHVKLKSALLKQEIFPLYITLITFFFLSSNSSINIQSLT